MPRRFFRYLPARAAFQLVASVFLVLVVLGGFAACTAHARRTPAGAYPVGVPLLAVAEEHGDSVEFWLLDPRDVSRRWRYAVVPHRQDWGVRASVSPDGRTLVYAVLPRPASDPDTDAQLWALPLGGSARRLASGIDLRSRLVWSPDSRWVSYDKNTAAAVTQVRRVSASGAGDQQIVRSTSDSRWYLMGYRLEGSTAVLAHLAAAGTEIVLQPLGRAPVVTTSVSPSSSRDFSVGPDGRPALLALQEENGRKLYRALACDAGGSCSRLTDGGEEDTGIAWNPRTGEPTVGVVPGSDRGRVAAAAGARLDLPADGFDVPVVWSPDGSYLAARHFSGSSTEQPGQESAVLIGADGRRTTLSGGAPTEIIGWMLPRR